MSEEQTLPDRAGQLGTWFAEYADHHVGKGDREKAARNTERAIYAYALQDDIATLQATVERQAAEIARLRGIAAAMRDDHQTSETHHPDHILVTRKDFDALCQALGDHNV